MQGNNINYQTFLQKEAGKFGRFKKTLYLCTRFQRNHILGSGFSAVGSAHVWGARGRWFESSNPDRTEKAKSQMILGLFVFIGFLEVTLGDVMGDFQSQPRSQPRFMEATISVICNKFKVLKNGESPIMVRVAKDGKRSMKSLGVSVNPAYWDFSKNIPKKNCPNRAMLMQLISQALIEYQGKVMEVKVKGENVPLSSIMEEKRNGIAPITLEDFLTSHISQLRDNGKVGNSYAYLNLRTTLHNFYGKKLNFLFNVVDVAFCNKFEAWMRKNQFEDTTMHYYFLTSAVLKFQ